MKNKEALEVWWSELGPTSLYVYIFYSVVLDSKINPK